MIKAIIIDDEKSQCTIIKNLLSKRFADIQVIGEAHNVSEGVSLIKNKQPNIVFLDIELPDGTGFDILKSISKINFKIIFITGFKEFAIDAFKFSAIDYILKPVNISEFDVAVKKALANIDLQNQSLKLDALFVNLQNISSETKKMVLKTQNSIHLVNVQNIIRCQSDNAYVTFYLNNGKKIVITASMKDYTENLSKYGFFRPHQSHLINQKFISRFDKKSGGCIVLSDNSEIPVSQRKKQEVLEIIRKICL